MNVSIYETYNSISNKDEDDINQWNEMKNVFNEIKQKQLLYGINFIDMYKSFNNNYIFISEQYGQSLLSVIQTKQISKTLFSKEEIISIAYQLLLAINEFNENDIWLISLQPHHIFLNKNDLKIQNHIFDILFPYNINYDNNLKYIPPEYLFFPNKQTNPSSSSPIWSLGILLLEMLSNINQFANYQEIMPSYIEKRNEYINDYIDLLKLNINGSLINKEEVNVDYDTVYPKDVLYYVLQGKLICGLNGMYHEIEDDLYYFIKDCLIVDCDNRKNAKEMLEHSLFKKWSGCIRGIRDNGDVICLLPLDKESIKNKLKQSYLLYNNKECKNDINDKQIEEEMISLLTIEDHYTIMKDILQINIINYLTDINLLQHPIDLLSLQTLYNDNEHNININHSYIKLKTFISLSFPTQYNSKNDLNGNQFSLYYNTDILKEKALSSISHYIKIKRIVLSLFYRFQLYTKEDLINELKKTQSFPSIPTSLRLKTYCILLDINSFNIIDTSSLLPYINIKTTIPDYNHIISDLNRNITSPLLKVNIFKIISLLSLNNSKFFYVQGMDSMICIINKLTHNNIDITYQIFNSFYDKFLLHNFYDDKTKSISNLNFHHLIISRLLLYYEPVLYNHLTSSNILDTPFITSELLTLFTRVFSYEDIFYIWDMFFIININIMYMIIINIFIQMKDKLMMLKGENIHLGIKTFIKKINIKQVCIDSFELYKQIPHCFIPMFHDFNPTVIEELKKNEYFKNRWWDLCDFYTDDIKVPVLTLEDTIKNYENILFIDIRGDNNLSPKIKEAIIYKRDFELDKYVDMFMNKIIVLVGNKESEYNSIVNILLDKHIKHICILQGGIDIMQTDEQSLLI